MSKLQELKNVLLSEKVFMDGPGYDPENFLCETKEESYKSFINFADKLLTDYMKGLTLTGAEFFEYLYWKNEIIDKFMSGTWYVIYDVYWKTFADFAKEVLNQVREDD